MPLSTESKALNKPEVESEPVAVRVVGETNQPFVPFEPLMSSPTFGETVSTFAEGAEETIQRLPELVLMAGSILSFLAATLPATPTGFWDKKPKRTPGRFRRTLAGQAFPKVANLSRRLRKKNSVTAHLPTGYLARMAKIVPVTPLPALF